MCTAPKYNLFNCFALTIFFKCKYQSHICLSICIHNCNCLRIQAYKMMLLLYALVFTECLLSSPRVLRHHTGPIVIIMSKFNLSSVHLSTTNCNFSSIQIQIKKFGTMKSFNNRKITL